MILYFADRRMNILGSASTGLPEGLTIVDDVKIDEVDTGVATFECSIAFDAETRESAEKYASVGNYLLRSYNGENGFFTIIDSELDTKAQEIQIYAEDAGLDLLNEICVAYEADKDYPITHYIEKFAYDSGFVIGINEASDLSRKLKWEGESTAAERLASVATQFDNCEISYSFEIKGLTVIKKYINIYKERGSETGVQLRLNKEVDRITEKKSIANLATALKVTGGTPESDGEGENVADPKPITLDGYTYDDGDIFLEGTYLKSRSAHAIWSRYLAEDGDYTGHIMRTFTYDTTSQSELCNRAVAELKKISQVEVNYEAEVQELPEHIRIGDRVCIIDDAGEIYVSTRILKMEESATNESRKATLGEFLMKDSGIDADVARLAAQFAKSSTSAARALTIAKDAKGQAVNAQAQAQTAIDGAVQAQQVADNAKAVADAATESAANATAKADAAEQAVGEVKEDVASIEKTVDDANAAAEQARQAAATAEIKASEAQTAAIEAKEDAADAKEQAGVAKTNSETAITKSDEAKTTAEQAIDEAAAAKATADAAKLDSEQAKKDLAEFEENLTTMSNTMQADYARKTELTETEASLQSQITQNAAQIQSTASKVLEVDETANNAAEQAAQAQETAAAAQEQADKATEDAVKAQTAADAAALAASNAQSEADKAKAAAATAQGVADKAEEDLAAAKADLATVQGRVDATEEDIAAAQQAVETAQAAADKAKADAADATAKANAAQGTADTAVANAETAQTKANEAAQAAALAQQTADGAKGDAAAAKKAADDAAAAARTAQQTADTAKTNAETAQSKANEAAAAASAAQTAADNADAKAQQAAADLAAAEQNLADVTSRVDATEEEVEAAQAAVETAQAKADEANAAAVAAQSTADTAKADAEKAQTDADNAKKAADDAQAAAVAAQKAADDAQDAVDALAVRVTKTETDIVQTSEQIKLLATKTEVAQTLGGYYTKEQADAAIDVKANEITSSVASQIEAVKIGGRNIIRNTAYDGNGQYWSNVGSDASIISDDYLGKHNAMLLSQSGNSGYVWRGSVSDLIDGDFAAGDQYTLSGWAYVYSDITADANLKINVYGTGASGNVYLFDMTLNDLAKNTWVYFSANAQVPSNFTSGVIFPHVEKNGKFKLANLKLEKGNKATDWSPAPEDLASVSDVTELSTRVTQTEESITSQATSISGHETRISTIEQSASGIQVRLENAEKVATNFLSYDATDGLLIGNKSSGSWSGYRAQVLPSAFNILDSSGNQIASYGANNIKLGLNGNDTEILFGVDVANSSYIAKLRYDSDYNYADIQSERIALIGQGEDGYAAIGLSYDGDWYYVSSNCKVKESGASLLTLYYEYDTLAAHSTINLSRGYCSIETTDHIILKSPIVNVTGDFGVDGDVSVTGTLGVDKVTASPSSVSWINGRAGAAFKSTVQPSTTGTYLPLMSVKSYSGSWEIGTGNDSLYFSYATDANHEAGTNSTTKVLITSAGNLQAPSMTLSGILNVGGDAILANNTNLLIKNKDNQTVSALILDSTNNLILGKDTGSSIKTDIYGSEINIKSQSGAIYITPYGSAYNFIAGMVNSNLGPTLRCSQNNYGTLGYTDMRWNVVYAVNGVKTTSDARLKKNISDDFSKLVEAFLILRPVTFEYADIKDGKIRIGFVAQELEEAFLSVGLDPDKFALLQKDTLDPESEMAKFIGDTTVYSLNYAEFSPYAMAMAQILFKEVATLKEEIEKLKGQNVS